MTKYIKKLIYVLVACVIITFVNSILFWMELALAILPNYIDFSNYVSADTLVFILDPVVYIMFAANFIISICAYAYVGIKAPETNNTIFEVIMLFVPFLFDCPGLLMVHCKTFGEWEYIAFMFLSSWGTLIVYLYNTIFKYIIALFPSVCMSIGYIIRVIYEKQGVKNSK